MWINKAQFDAIEKRAHEERVLAGIWQADYAGASARLVHLQIENAHLKTTLDWFKHRLNQVEMERAQLIYAATGGTGAIPREVKIPVPNFAGGEPLVSDVLNAQYNPFGTTGEDSSDPGDQTPLQREDVSNMPRSSR